MRVRKNFICYSKPVIKVLKDKGVEGFKSVVMCSSTYSATIYYNGVRIGMCAIYRSGVGHQKCAVVVRDSRVTGYSIEDAVGFKMAYRALLKVVAFELVGECDIVLRYVGYNRETRVTEVNGYVLATHSGKYYDIHLIIPEKTIYLAGPFPDKKSARRHARSTLSGYKLVSTGEVNLPGHIYWVKRIYTISVSPKAVVKR